MLHARLLAAAWSGRKVVAAFCALTHTSASAQGCYFARMLLRRAVFAWPLLIGLACGSDDEGSGGAGAGQGVGGDGASAGNSNVGGGSGAAGGGAAVGGGGQGGAAPQGDPVMVAVGYGGRRLRSIDAGLTWEALVEDDPAGGDDTNLLRAATYAHGLFIAAGWRIHTSPDGITWTEHTVDGQQWCGGLASGNGVTLCTGGCGDSLMTSDGVQWQAAGDATPNECAHMRSLAFGNGRFVARGDNDRMVTTTDGMTWSDLPSYPAGNVVFRDGAFWANGDGTYIHSTDGLTWDTQTGSVVTDDFGQGVYLRGPWQGKIERSLDAVTWDEVYNDGGNALSAFAFGYAAP